MFNRVFFRFYDRQIAAGVVSFSQVGIAKEDFIKLSTGQTCTLSEETVRTIGENLKLTEEEQQELLCSAGY
ncbi:MAG: hypothetical protein RR626_01700 [Anaerovoracaceae bacterium]